ncbi:S9 family peptidase [Solimonas soli]|uniref:S9 family peptidase n=1 Tax=Solimonas soli TaxID=413479 RepID=UPI0004818E52|nr:S9 family peptidase [Solimonas soli]
MRILASTLTMFALLLGGAAHAEKLTPERLFADPDLNGPRVRGVQLSPDGRIVSYLKAKPDNQNVLDLWAVNTRGGEPYRLIDANTLGAPDKALSEAEKARRERQRVSQRGVVDYAWSADSRSLLVPVDGDLFVVDRATHAPRRLTETPADEIDAKLSPRGRYVSYVREQNLYVRSLRGGDERALTTDGAGTLSWATAEFVAQEEMDRDTGYWWSPDEQRIALTRVDETGVDVIERLDLGPQGATTVAQRYPRVGRPNAIVSLFVADVASGARVAVDLGPDTDIYLARVEWSRDGRTLYVQRQARDQKRLDLLACEPETGACAVILSETSPHWVELSKDFQPLADGDFLWSSERSGWRHLYLYHRDGTLVRQITGGDWPVAALLGVDETHQRLFFAASIDDPLGKQIWSVAYERGAEPRRLTDGEGVWTASFAERGNAFVGTYSDPRTPPRTALYDASGRRLRWIEANALDATHPYHAYLDHHRVPQFGTLSADDGTPLYYSLATPPGFDPRRKYPAIVLVYGGPHVQTVTKAWGDLKDQLYLAAGYVVFRLDNRGSDNRSVAFKTAIDRHLGTVEVRDQRVGVNFLKSLPYVDAARIGYQGWSYGGFMTLRMLTEPGAGIRAGAAGGPPTDFALYDTHYTERYMGTPADNAEGYRGTDILPRLPNLSGRLLLMHGMADDNVLFANSTRLMEALQQRGIVFDLMTYPGQRHGVRGNAKQLQQWRTYLDFFGRELKPDP